MSELRQRRGEKEGAETTTLVDSNQAPKSTEEVLKEAEDMLAKIREGPKPGLSNDAKQWKDALREDPYNMQLIFQLGLSYAKDQQWDKCANVMLRGFKRVGEFEEKEVRLHFLMTLCQASMAQNKFRQALMVFNDIEEPDDDDMQRRYEALKCYVLCSNGDASSGLKAFHKAIEGQEFDLAVGFWALSYPGLQKVGALEATRSKLEEMCTDEQMKKRLELVELVRQLKQSTANEREQQALNRKYMLRSVIGVLIVALFILAYALHHVEKSNLEKLKIKI